MSTSDHKATNDEVFRFETFRLDRRGNLYRLSDDGSPTPAPLGARAFEILTALADRAGELVTKQVLMEAAWPGMVVEDSNLTVQISALRRILDEGRAGGSCIQTVIGRGYRFLPAVTPDTGTPDVGIPSRPSDSPTKTQQQMKVRSSSGMRRHYRLLMGLSLMAICLGLGTLGWRLTDWPLVGGGRTPPSPAPRMSVVVLPFQNLSGNPAENALADGITDDLTTDLSHIPEAFVIARASADLYRNKSTDVRQIGRELGVRYVLEGSMRKLGTTLRVNAQLVSAESGQHLWSDRFDEDLEDFAEGQQRVVARMWGGLRIGMVEIERERSQRERPTNPDAFDFVLQARALRNQPMTAEQAAAALALYEHALLLDPGSPIALAGAAYLLAEQRITRGFWSSLEAMERMDELIARAVKTAPASEEVLLAQMYSLRAQGRWADALTAAQRFTEMFPNMAGGYFVLAGVKTYTGGAAEVVGLNEKGIRLNPQHPYLLGAYRLMGFASLLLGRDREAIAFYQRSLAPNVSPAGRQNALRQMAAAYERTGDGDQARRALAEADRLWPFDTVRSHFPDNPTSAVYVAQVTRYQDTLRRLGLRDHADEDADFGVTPDSDLHQLLAGRTPTTVPGARTIRTDRLVALIAERNPIIIDAMSCFWGRSIPSAVGLPNAGSAGSLAGSGQDRLRRAISVLTGGDLARPIVAVGWNSERFDGRNLALRLVAMGYTDVYWYRGGREAWEVNGLPETELATTEW